MNDYGFDRDKFLSETWPEALRSGLYERGTGRLYKDGKYCPLGVACALLERDGISLYGDWRKGYELPFDAVNLLGISENGRWSATSYASSISWVNDNDEMVTFEQLADLIVLHKDDLLAYVKPY